MKTQTVTIEIELTKQGLEVVDAMVNTGLRGLDRSDVCTRIVEAALAKMVEEVYTLTNK